MKVIYQQLVHLKYRAHDKYFVKVPDGQTLKSKTSVNNNIFK